MLRQAKPIEVRVPDDGVSILESIHDPSFRMEPRVDPFHKLFFVGRGSIAFQADQNHVNVSEGRVVFVPQGLRHHIVDVEGSTLFLLCFTDALGQGFDDWEEIRQSLGIETRVWPALPFESALLPLWRRMLSEDRRDDIGSRTLLKTEAIGLLVRLARMSGNSVPSNNPVGGLIDEVERTSFEPWTVDEAARRSGLSRRQFTKVFREETGRTFVEALTLFRISRVKELLSTGGYSVAGAAYASGFGDIAHFYRTFKRYEGTTPLRWLEAAQGAGS